MFFKIKTFFVHCCGPDPKVTDPADVEARIKLSNRNLAYNELNIKTETDTVTQVIQLTTAEDDITAKGPKLKLIALEGDIVPINKEFLINGKGMEFGGRSKADGVISIGRQKLAPNTHIIINDIVLEDPSVGEKHCLIKYNPSVKKYFVKDQGEGSGTFIKVQEPTKIKNGCVISFSDSHMMINIANPKFKEGSLVKSLELSTERPGKEEITIKFLDGPKASQTYKFGSEEAIKIGRMGDCQIKFDGNNLSRYQCSLIYKDGFWYVCDGYNDKTSTNGTWIFVDHFHEIVPGTIIKIGQTLFKADIC